MTQPMKGKIISVSWRIELEFNNLIWRIYLQLATVLQFLPNVVDPIRNISNKSSADCAFVLFRLNSYLKKVCSCLLYFRFSYKR